MSKRLLSLKRCASCGETKPIVYFGKQHGKRDGLRCSCKDCTGKKQDINLNRRIGRWKWGATKRGIEWKLTHNYINSLPKICFYTGLKLTNKRNRPNTLSLDRKDSQRGYVKNNVVFCCATINYMKSDLGIKEFLGWCKKITKFNKKAL